MRAAVKVWTIQHDHLECVQVTDPSDVGEWIRVMAGPAGEAGEESFDLLVCTPAWLAREVAKNGPQVGRHYLIVESWDAARVRSIVTHLFERETAENWPRLGEKLARLGHWEFEDYRPYEGN